MVTASILGALRKARRKRALVRRAPPSDIHLEKITVQEKTEKQASTPRTMTSRRFFWTISRSSACRRKAKGASKLNLSPIPNLSLMTMRSGQKDGARVYNERGVSGVTESPKKSRYAQVLPRTRVRMLQSDVDLADALIFALAALVDLAVLVYLR